MHVYATVARYEPIPRGTGDPSHYMTMAEGKPLDQTPVGYRRRVLTPLIIRAMPGLPAFVGRHYSVDADKVLRFKFALWNCLGGVAAAFALMLFIQGLGLSAAQGAAGALLYATSTQVLLDGAAPLVDPWANAAIIGGLYFNQQGRLWALGLSFALGLFVKETLLVLPAYLALQGFKGLWRRAAWMAPGFIAFVAFYLRTQEGPGAHPDAGTMFAMLAGQLDPARLAYIGTEFALNFALLAPLAALGWASSAKLPTLRRMAWLLPALFLVPLLKGTELARPWFAGFPVFIPLAVLGIWSLLETARTTRTSKR